MMQDPDESPRGRILTVSRVVAAVVVSSLTAVGIRWPPMGMVFIGIALAFLSFWLLSRACCIVGDATGGGRRRE